MAWTILGVAVITEIAWALSMKWAATNGTWTGASIPIMLNFVNMGLLAIAMRTLPAGTAYAVRTGLGAVGVAIMGVVLFGGRLNPTQVAFISLVIVGVIGTKLFATVKGSKGSSSWSAVPILRPMAGFEERGRSRPLRKMT